MALRSRFSDQRGLSPQFDGKPFVFLRRLPETTLFYLIDVWMDDGFVRASAHANDIFFKSSATGSPSHRS